ncbi:MAG: class I SAM-dependent methyltransferase [Promethearchaeota archaeon]
MKYYDEKNKRLIIFQEKANSEFWDKHWQSDNFVEKVKLGERNSFIKKITKKYLTQASKILEGGCETGQNVYGLNCWGYDAYGCDFAENTINKIKREFPNLKVSTQDVRKLKFPNNFFDGYWSLGVIEHFYQGYDEILAEAKRVIKPGGYLFLTFPYMSHLRKFKANLRLYKIFDFNNKLKNDDFYEFILNAEEVKGVVENYRFKLISKYPFDATKGIKDEITWTKPILQKVYNSRNIIAKGIRFLNSILFSNISSHNILLVFKKL